MRKILAYILSVLLAVQASAIEYRRTSIHAGPLANLESFRSYVRSQKPTLFLDPDHVQSVTQDSVARVSSLATLYGSVNAFTQGTDANKPVLSRPDRIENIYGNSEALGSLLSLVRASVSSNTTVAPDGTTTADSLIENVGTGTSYFGYPTAPFGGVISGASYRFSVYAKQKGTDARSAALRTDGGGSGFANGWAYFNTTTCAVISKSGSVISQTATDVGNGWCKIEATAAANATTTSQNWSIYLYNTDTSSVFYDGDGTSGVYLWGAQFQRASMQPTYIATTTVPVYGSLTGRRMLTFDGSNDTMASTSLYSDIYGASAKTIFAVGHSSAYTATQNILSDNAGSNGRLVYHHGSGYIGLRNNDGSTVANAPLAPPSANTPIALMSWHDGTNLFSAYNRLAAVSVASGATAAMSGSLKLGSTGSAEYWNGQLGPIITFNRVLPQPVRDTIRAGLQKFWRVN